MKKYSGFTLIELMITLAIVAIVTTLAIPGMSEFVKNERLTSASNNLLGDIMLARSKAVERNQPVIICASNDQANCNGNYEDGWIITIDSDSDGIGDEIIKIQQATEGNITYDQGGAGLSIITFDSRGFLPTGANTGTISVCDNRTNPDDYAKTISLSATGRASRGANPACP
ncbi:MAG: prepilin-type N-terminal cleavage/methylation domain-containing protein [Gammaproteobacteria bacterium]|nr:prepilin-type N-terminal cleavage/methylation domain-containing protein [Gammaproteobacteria bacterium]